MKKNKKQPHNTTLFYLSGEYPAEPKGVDLAKQRMALPRVGMLFTYYTTRNKGSAGARRLATFLNERKRGTV